MRIRAFISLLFAMSNTAIASSWLTNSNGVEPVLVRVLWFLGLIIIATINLYIGIRELQAD